MNKLDEAYKIARTADVSSLADSVVLYSVNFLPSKENKIKAMEYVKTHLKSITLDTTECGKKLIELGLETNHKMPHEELMKVWAIASERFIAAASGNITAFADNADPRSTFRRIELPGLLKNEKITTVNGIDKFKYAERFNNKS